MSLTSSMMYISPALLLILYGYIGFSESAPRISPSDASSISSRKPGSGGWDAFRTGEPRAASPGTRTLSSPPAGITSHPTSPGSPGSEKATTFQPPTTDPTTTTSRTTATPDAGIISPIKEQITAPSSRLTLSRKRSTDAQTSLFSPEKMLQTMVSMVSQHTTNDAWAADNADASVTSVENSQEGVCNCSSGTEGISDPDVCNQSTGQCSCLLGYTGLQCEECEEEYFTNGTSGCLPCSCDSFGAVSPDCDSSGTCTCKTGVYGPKCDECHPGFFHFSNTGCRLCQCNNHTNYCHPQSGVCLNCEGNTQGSNCEECKVGFFRRPGAAPTEVCAPCPCSNSTSTGTCLTDSSGSAVCERCLSHYSGPHCDQCSPGFYNTSGTCAPCDCSGNADPLGPAQLCDPKTGSCLRCINNTSGSRCHECASGFVGDARAHNCTRPKAWVIPAPAEVTTKTPMSGGSSPTSPFTSTTLTSTATKGNPVHRSNDNGGTALGSSTTTTTTQALLTSLSSPTDNTTAALKEVSWTQFKVIILAVIILVVVLLLGFVGGVYTYREYQNRKLNAPFWTIELKEDNISFSSYHDSIPNADVSGLLEDEATEVAPNGQLALTTQANNYKA